MNSEACPCLSRHEQERILSVRKHLDEYLEKEAERAFQGECVGQIRLSEAEVEMDTRRWARRNYDIALYETNQQLESQRLELYQAIHWADQAQREKHTSVWRIECEEQNQPNKSRNKLPRH